MKINIEEKEIKEQILELQLKVAILTVKVEKLEKLIEKQNDYIFEDEREEERK